jgi:hypothetical protein
MLEPFHKQSTAGFPLNKQQPKVQASNANQLSHLSIGPNGMHHLINTHSLWPS